MKLLYRILRAMLTIIGLLTVILIAFTVSDRIDITIEEGGRALYGARVDSLRTSGAYRSDSLDFKMRVVQDSAKAKEIRDYFQLDTLYNADASSWDRALAIAGFVAENIPHANQKVEPEHRNAIALWEYTKNVEPAFNCRLHSILTFELMLAADLTPKFITCMPVDRYDNDCHVVNEVWLPELGKWAMIDSDMGGNYVCDKNGIPLSLSEMRKHYISGEKMFMHPGFGKGSDKFNYYYSYMAKNTYWFNCWENLTYGVEDHLEDGVDPGRVFNLIPPGFEPFNTSSKSINTSNADLFWATPE